MAAAKKKEPEDASGKPPDPDLPSEVDFSGGIRGRHGPRQVAALLRYVREVKGDTKHRTAVDDPAAVKGKTGKTAVSSARSKAGVTDWSELVGKFFHTFNEDGKIGAQGVVLADVGEGYYVVGHFEWITGQRSFYGTHLVHISTIATEGWSLYSDDETMRDAYEYGGKAPRN